MFPLRFSAPPEKNLWDFPQLIYKMCNSLVSCTPPHLCQPTEQKGWASPQLQSPALSTTSFIPFPSSWLTCLACQLTQTLAHMCLLKPEQTGHLQLIITQFHMFGFPYGRFLFQIQNLLQSVASADRAQTIFPRSPMCGNW